MKHKIIIIGPTPPPHHGVAVSTKAILDSTALEAFDLVHFDTADRRSIENIGRFDFTNVRLALAHGWRFSCLLIKFRPDIIYLPLSQGILGYLRDALFLYLSRLFNCKIVAHLRGGNYRDFYMSSPFWMKWIIRSTLAGTSRVIVLGKSLKGMFDGIFPSSRVAVIPNGTRDFLAGKFLPERKRLSHLKVLFLGNLNITKGTQVVLKAARKVIDSVGPTQFVFVGEWCSDNEKKETLDLVRHLHLEPFVDFMGVLTGVEKEAALLDADIQVFPSYYPSEGHPRVIIEGMAAGLPIIATNHATIPETIIDGETGFIVPKHDDNSLAERLITLITHENLKKSMGEKARQRFLAHYTAEISNERLAALFTEVLEED